MAEAIVDLLEPVQVEEEHRKRLARALGSRELAGELLAEAPPVAKTGQIVGRREPDQLRPGLDVAERERRDLGEVLGQLELVQARTEWPSPSR